LLGGTLNGDSTIIFSGTVANINAALDGLQFDPTLSFSGSTSLTVSTSDLGNNGIGGPQTDNGMVVINVSFTNAAPVLTGANDLSPINEDAAANSGTSVLALIAGHVTDANSGSLSGIAVIAVDNTNGTWEYSTNNGGSWTAIGSPSANSALLLAENGNTFVRFVPNPDWNGSVANGLTFRAWDQTSGSAGSIADTTTNGGTTAFSVATASSSITVNAVNDAPGVTAPGNIGVTEDVATALTGISFSDVDAGGASVVATFTVPLGTLAAASGGGVTVGGTPTALTLTGSTASINAFIAASNLTYTTAPNDTNPVILGVSIDDQGNTGSGGAQSSGVSNVTLNVTPVNDAPTGTVTITGVPTEDQVLTASNTLADSDGLGAISYQWQRNNVNIAGATGNSYTLDDADVGTIISVVASYIDGNGTPESVNSSGVGPIANVNDAPVGVPTITGTVSEDQILTADISGISDADGLGPFGYQWLRNGSPIAGATANTYTLGDADVGTFISVQASFTDAQGTAEGPLTSAPTASVSGINDAPTISSLTVQSVVEGNVLTFSTTGGNAIAVSDVDAGALNVQLSLSAVNGKLTLASLAGLSFSSGDGIDDTTMVFTGSLANINNALDGLRFSPNAGFTGSASVSATIDDQGNSGAGGALLQAGTFNINVVASAIPPGPGTPPPPPVAPPVTPPTADPDPEPDTDSADSEDAGTPTIAAAAVISSGGNAATLTSILADDSTKDAEPLRPLDVSETQPNRSIRIAAAASKLDVGYFGLSGADLASGDLSFVVTPTIPFPSFDSGYRALNAPEFVDQLDRMRDILEQQAQTSGIIVTSGTAATIGLSVGYLFWLLRAEVLLGSLLSSMPAWRMVDPLPVLGRLAEDDGDDAEDDDSLESMVERKNRVAQDETFEDIEAI